LVATLLAAVVLRERVQAGIWIALVLGLVGSMVIIRPGGENFHYAHLLALAGGISVAAYQIMTRLVAQRSDARTTLLYMALAATLITSSLMPFTERMPAFADWWCLLAASLVYLIGHGIYIFAHVRAEASRLAPFVYAQLIGSVSAAFVFFGQLPTLHTILGMLIIVVAGAIPLILRAQRLPPP